jgi:phosphoribosylanthranilate isomerase
MADARPLPRVKVCGLTRPEDLAAAVAAGCDAVGLVEHPPSPRAVAARRARELTGELPPEVLPVGVFVDRSPAEVERWLRAAGARAAQLCGAERAEHWRSFAFPLLRRLAVADGALEELERWEGTADGFVLDHPSAPGGTGRAVVLLSAARLASLAPCLLAGGLDGDNVAERVAAVRPAGVDASSALESGPGRKDAGRLRSFVENARRALDALREGAR